MRDFMKKLELLAPAGTMDALKAAIHNGCDAVYLGGVMFGARAFAGNFDHDAMIEAIQYAHLYGVKVYVTMNTLIYEDEIDAAYEEAKFLYKHGVDALIIQDLGFFDRLHIQLPDLELHASTQMHIHNAKGIRFIKEKGAKRVVLPRETPIERIREFAEEQIELEVFVHGALCISYSGQCLMSHELFHRSGNRGECAQACRMKYRLIKLINGEEKEIETDGEYLLSPRDLNTLDEIPKLIEAGVTSFKIEGRMKRPEYVAQVVSLYRKAIDAAICKQPFKMDRIIENNLLSIFNRKFTKGYAFHADGMQLMNPIRPNHLGVKIGKVIYADKKKMTILLDADIQQGDGIRVLQTKEDQGFLLNKILKDGLLVNSAKKGDKIQLECSQFIERNAIVIKTSDVKQLQTLQNYPSRKISVSMNAKFKIGYPMHLTLTDGIHVIKILSDTNIEQAQTAKVEERRIREQLSKCKDTPFQIHELEIDMDENCFLSIKSLNQIRRSAFAQLEQKRKEVSINLCEEKYEKQMLTNVSTQSKVLIIVHTKEQLEACLENGVKVLYTTSKNLAIHHGLIYTKGCVQNMMDDSPFVRECGGITKQEGTICEPSLYAANSYTCALLREQGIQQIIFPYEMTLNRMETTISCYRNRFHDDVQFGVEIYGYRDMMVSEYCPIYTYESHSKHCDYCRKQTYFLSDIHKNKFPLMSDEDCRMHVMTSKPYDDIQQWQIYKKIGIEVYQLRFTVETKTETNYILQKWNRGFTE